MSEYKNHLDRLQMSLFSMLYRNAGGYLIEPNYVFRRMKENTEWGKLLNFPQVYKKIENEYAKEVNNTLSGVPFISVDSCKADERFRTKDAKPNKEMINSYKSFVLAVGKKCGFEFKEDFEYFQK